MQGFLRKKGKARQCLMATAALLLVISMLPIGPMAAAIDIPDAPVLDFQTAPAATGLVSNLTG